MQIEKGAFGEGARNRLYLLNVYMSREMDGWMDKHTRQAAFSTTKTDEDGLEVATLEPHRDEISAVTRADADRTMSKRDDRAGPGAEAPQGR